MKFKIVNRIFIGLIFLLLLISWQKIISYFILLFPFLIWIFITLYGAFEIRFNYFLKAFHRRNNTKEKVISLTFDDGPTEFTPRFLEILKKNKAKATFFSIGRQIEKYPEITKKTDSEGHLIGNHTYNHSVKNGFYSSQKIIQEITSTDQIIELTIQKKTKLFRPPFGVTNPSISKAISKTKHQVIGWSIRSLDTVIDDEEKLFRRITRQIKPGSIILLHDTSDKTANVLEQLFVFLQKENYKVIPLEELLKLNGYEN